MYIASRSAFVGKYTECRNMHGVTQSVTLNTSCKQIFITAFKPVSRFAIRSSCLSFHLTILSQLTDTADSYQLIRHTDQMICCTAEE